MRWKIQGIFVAFGVIAVFLSWQFLSSLKIPQTIKTTPEELELNQLLLSFSFGDTDKDGLLDREESVWGSDFQNPDTDGDGYLDGEEVATGHDPTVLGPNDYIDGFGGENLSQRLQEMVVAGLAEGSLKPSADSFSESTAAIAEDLARKLEEQATIPEPQILITNDTETQKAAYFKAMIPLMEALPNTIVPRSENPFTYPPEHREQIIAILEKFGEIPTPQSWAQFHARIMADIATIDRAYTLLANAEAKDDLVTKLGILNQLADVMYTELPQIYNNFFAMLEQFAQ